MKQIIKKLCLHWQARKKKKKAIKAITQLKGIEIVYKKETSITLGCLTTGSSGNKPSLSWNGVELLVKEKTGDVKDFFRKVYKESKANNVSPQKYLDELAELTEKANLRRAALSRWSRNFEQKFHKHFDGEIEIRFQNDGVTIANKKMVGAHNHELIGVRFEVIDVYKPVGSTLDNLPDNVPFKAKVKMAEDGVEYIKIATSTFFPKNWNIIRIKEEIALVYDKMLTSGKVYHPRDTNRKFDFMNSDGTFEIHIEVDELGNFTNAYPLIN